MATTSVTNALELLPVDVSKFAGFRCEEPQKTIKPRGGRPEAARRHAKTPKSYTVSYTYKSRSQFLQYKSICYRIYHPTQNRMSLKTRLLK